MGENLNRGRNTIVGLLLVLFLFIIKLFGWIQIKGPCDHSLFDLGFL